LGYVSFEAAVFFYRWYDISLSLPLSPSARLFGNGAWMVVAGNGRREQASKDVIGSEAGDGTGDEL
jgi:hypothetical protein